MKSEGQGRGENSASRGDLHEALHRRPLPGRRGRDEPRREQTKGVKFFKKEKRGCLGGSDD